MLVVLPGVTFHVEPSAGNRQPVFFFGSPTSFAVVALGSESLTSRARFGTVVWIACSGLLFMLTSRCYAFSTHGIKI